MELVEVSNLLKFPHFNEFELAFFDYLQTDYTMILAAFKDLLQHHVFTDVTEAMMSCWELEQALHALTGKHIIRFYSLWLDKLIDILVDYLEKKFRTIKVNSLLYLFYM